MQPTASSLECPNCLTQNPESKKYCRECGVRLRQACTQCGSEILPKDKFCGECGQKLGEKERAETTKPGGKVVPLKKHHAMRRHLSELRADSIGQEVSIEKAWGSGACRTIAICNQKGGVGKTVTAINLSARLAASGRPTLLIDLDPQGHSGLGLGLDVDALDRSVYDVLLNGTFPARDAIVPLRPNLDILPSNVDLAMAELELAGLKRRERRLKEVIDGFKESYESIVIDCPPSIGILTVNALMASQIVIVPVTPSYLSLHGLSRVMEVLDALKDSLFLGVAIFSLVTFFERRSREARFQKRTLEGSQGQHLLKTVIRKNTKLSEATRKGVPIFEYDPNCPGSRDYADLVREIVSIDHQESRATEKGRQQLGAL